MMGDLLSVIKRIRLAGVAFLVVLAMGTLGYLNIGGLETTVVDAFYMTAITISTVGFHEVVDLEGHPYGRLFTVFLAFSGFGVLTYLLSNLIALFIEGDIRSTFIIRKMQKKIDKMEDHYIICGCGRVGRNIAIELYKTDRDFVMVDRDENTLEKLAKDEINDAVFISGDCTEDDFLESLGIKKAKGLFVTTGDDNTNLVICLTARQLNPAVKIVSRAKGIVHTRKLKRAGANRVVSPNYIGGIRMASEMLRPAVTSFLDEMMRSEINQRLEEFIVPEHLDGKKIGSFPIEDLNETIIISLRKSDTWKYNPGKEEKIHAGDHIILMTTPSDRKTLENRLSL